jgi:hypothetical protein
MATLRASNESSHSCRVTRLGLNADNSIFVKRLLYSYRSFRQRSQGRIRFGRFGPSANAVLDLPRLHHVPVQLGPLTTLSGVECSKDRKHPGAAQLPFTCYLLATEGLQPQLRFCYSTNDLIPQMLSIFQGLDRPRENIYQCA